MLRCCFRSPIELHSHDLVSRLSSRVPQRYWRICESNWEGHCKRSKWIRTHPIWALTSQEWVLFKHLVLFVLSCTYWINWLLFALFSITLIFKYNNYSGVSFAMHTWISKCLLESEILSFLVHIISKVTSCLRGKGAACAEILWKSEGPAQVPEPPLGKHRRR